MADDDGAKKQDARVAWLRSRIATSLRLKEGDGKTDRLFANEDSAAAVASFLDTGDTNRLLIYDAGKGELAAVRRSSTRARCADPTLTYSDSRAAPASPRCRRAS